MITHLSTWTKLKPLLVDRQRPVRFFLLILLIYFQPNSHVLAFDIYIPTEIKFKESSASADTYGSDMKTWKNKTYYVYLIYMDIILPEVDGLPEGAMTPEIALQFKYPELISDISENWSKEMELDVKLGEDWDSFHYKTFDAKKIKLGKKSKCFSFHANNDYEQDIIFGVYCKADYLTNKEILSALSSVTVDDTKASKP